MMMWPICPETPPCRDHSVALIYQFALLVVPIISKYKKKKISL